MENLTEVFLIRHSKKINQELIDNTKNTEYFQTRREKIVLSIEGERRAEKLSKLDIFNNLDIIFSSNYARTIQTAKYLAESKNLVIHVDERFNERKFGIRGEEDITIKQYYDENLKNPEGECRKEVSTRMEEAFWDVIHNNKGKKIAIFTHGASMTFLLMNWCKLENISKEKRKTLSFNNTIIVDKVFNEPEVFKITLDGENKIIKIENIEVEL